MKNKMKKYPNKKDTAFLNALLQDGFFKPIHKPCDWVWGINSFSWHDGYVNELQGRFLGGGICDSYGYEVKLGDVKFNVKHWGYALRCVLNYVKKNYDFSDIAS